MIQINFNKLKPQKEETIDKKTNVYDTLLELYNGLLETYFDEHFDLSDAKKKVKQIPNMILLI